MKKILITGKNSYIGKMFESYMQKWSEDYKIDKISLRGGEWKSTDFSYYDSIIHLAGIAHVSTDPKMEELYYQVNRDLTVEVAKKAKREGVNQFIFMSSIIVYGKDQTTIGRHTIPTPDNFYGRSKLEAEESLNKMQSQDFNIVLIRPPMIYGKGAKGNYRKLSEVAKKTPLFPCVYNYRSMLHINNLCEFLKLMIFYKEKGVFFPQNKLYVNTSEMVKMIAEVHKKKVRLTKVFNPILSILSKKVIVINKVFGDLVYEKSLSEYKKEYRLIDFRETIVLTEMENENNENSFS
ncbi:NAD-dependent epimerase/dehydratase family protein [Alkalicoccus urumqiensis]|uniref:NAD-dependent epimerase n=1 Tax=Alkalicoccus urumqiensis TaxID=1548213 RepID=A0A2P6MHR4_ALKUR|nr:NAD-dependent epimerase/dehydratase family protein [Alkalicoccus urumqiensis]PRO65834.1 NAD-dependent epimerase [Alkalicoccus urumqiensis]